MRLLRRPSPATVIAVVALVLAGSGWAVAASSPGTITACAKKRGGQLRLVTGKKKCAKSERKVSWAQAGPAGVAGPAGSPGVAGGIGPTGPAGRDGSDATVGDGSVTTAKLADGAVTRAKLATAARTPDVVIRRTPVRDVTNSSGAGENVHCQAGEVAISAGVIIEPGNWGAPITVPLVGNAFFPPEGSTPDGFSVSSGGPTVAPSDPNGTSWQAWILCAKP
jgi:hypothetical protein